MYKVVSLVVLSIVLPALALGAVCLRFHIRKRAQKNRLGIDDWMILIASVLVCFLGALQVTGNVSSKQSESYKLLTLYRSRSPGRAWKTRRR